MNDRELNAAYIITLYYGVPWVKISQFMYPGVMFISESLLYGFLTFYSWPRAPVLVSLLLQHDHSKQTEECKLHFARKCLARKWWIKCRKMNQKLWLACFLKMQKPIDCGTTTRKCQLLMGTPSHSSLSLLSHCGLILAYRVELVCTS